MDDAIFLLIGVGALSGGVAALAVYGILVMKLFRLQNQLGAVRDAILSLSNRGKANKRWSERDLLEQELLGVKTEEKPKPVPSAERYANDPLPFG
jgi:hypothetical protein